MRIKDTIRKVFHFLSTFRQCGTSTLIQEVAKQHDIYIIVARYEEKKRFGEQAICISELNKVEGLPKKPFLVDNYTLIAIMENAFQDLTYLEERNKEKADFIQDITRKVEMFNEKQKRHNGI